MPYTEIINGKRQVNKKAITEFYDNFYNSSFVLSKEEQAKVFEFFLNEFLNEIKFKSYNEGAWNFDNKFIHLKIKNLSPNDYNYITVCNKTDVCFQLSIFNIGQAPQLLSFNIEELTNLCIGGRISFDERKDDNHSDGSKGTLETYLEKTLNHIRNLWEIK